MLHCCFAISAFSRLLVIEVLRYITWIICLFVCFTARQSGAGVIGQIFFGCRRGWSNLLWEQAGLVRIHLGACGIGQNSLGSRRDWSNFLAGAGEIGQESLRSRYDWSNFLWEQTGLVRILLTADMIGWIASGEGSIGLSFCGSRRIWTEFLQDLVGLV